MRPRAVRLLLSVSLISLIPSLSAWLQAREGFQDAEVRKAKDVAGAEFRVNTTTALTQAFVLRLADGAAHELELVEVRDLGRRATAGGEISNYGLTFLARAPAPLPQAIYHLEHAMFGAMEVFLVPIGRDPVGIRYEAIFN